MRKLTVNIPDSVNKNNNELIMLIASRSYEDSILPSSRAVTLAGLTERTFIELMGKYGVSVFDTFVENLDSDIANA